MSQPMTRCAPVRRRQARLGQAGLPLESVVAT
jgi:hypothetical protein